MGAYLSEPITNKETQLEENDELRVASSSMQGWRVSQEVSLYSFLKNYLQSFTYKKYLIFSCRNYVNYYSVF